MPKVYLSPSLQEFNPYVDGGNEEYYMNLIADAMEPYLRASNIEFDRNSPEQTLTQAIEQSNKGNYDLHFAIHSNAAPENLAGKLRVLFGLAKTLPPRAWQEKQYLNQVPFLSLRL